MSKATFVAGALILVALCLVYSPLVTADSKDTDTYQPKITDKRVSSYDVQRLKKLGDVTTTKNRRMMFRDGLRVNRTSRICGSHQFRCPRGRCVALEHLCNGRADCNDNYDEIGCPNHILIQAQKWSKMMSSIPNMDTLEKRKLVVDEPQADRSYGYSVQKNSVTQMDCKCTCTAPKK